MARKFAWFFDNKPLSELAPVLRVSISSTWVFLCKPNLRLVSSHDASTH